jgi:L-tartrate/succinate antiporter
VEIDEMTIQWRAIVPLLLGAVVWLIPVPAGLTGNAWAYFALCIAVIAALIAEPIPGPVAGLLGVTAAAALNLVAANPDDSIRWALSGFSNGTVWLIFIAFMFGLGYEKTGLGPRLALKLVHLLGRSTIGLGYAIACADLILAPFMPSNTARSGGTIFPIIKNIPPLYGSSPGASAHGIGGYIMWTAFAAQAITSSMFLTGNAANIFAVSVLKETAKIQLSWSDWAIGFLPVGLLLFIALPPLVFFIYRPEVRASAEVPRWAGQELAKMGRIARREVIMGVIAVSALALWIFASERLNPATVALIAFGLMILTRLIEWQDVLAYQEAWKVLIWMATLITLADGLNKVGFLNWFAAEVGCACSGFPATWTLIIFVAIFFASHYLFASLTAHATALFAVFLAAGTAVPGMPVRPFALTLCYTLGLMGVLTPYATGPAPIYFGSGYITKRQFWLLGSLFGAIFLLVLLAIGVPYLLVTGP